MEALSFDGYMWDPEYSDSELRAVEASGKSRDKLCPSTRADSTETDGWCACDQAQGQEMASALLKWSASSRPQLSWRIPCCRRVAVLSLQLGMSF